MNFILLCFGFLLLIKGADYFVESSSSIAKVFNIPPIIIGLTIVAFGTSAPEASVSITAAINSQNGICVGNIIGSNIFNLFMVVGAAGFIKNLDVEKSILSKQFPFLILSSLLMIFLSLDIIFRSSSSNLLSSIDAILLLVLFFIYLLFLFKSVRKSRDNKLKEASFFINYNAIYIEDTKSTSKLILNCIIGVIGIIIGGSLVVNSASSIALGFGVSDELIGLTIISIGTSLPEFITSIVACTKNENDIALGNVVGSNIFNILFILGVSSFIYPITLSFDLLFDLILMLFSTLLVYVFATKKSDINKFESLSLMVCYLAYLTYLIYTL